jgi:DNA-binding transcriptional MerR regulator
LTALIIHANFRIIKRATGVEVLVKEKNSDTDTGAGKLVYRLDEICRLTKVTPETVKTWEKEFYFIHAGVTASGNTIFRKKDLDIIIRLKELLENEGLTLAGAKRRIEEEFGLKTPVPLHPDRLKKVLFQVREQLKELVSSLRSD